MSFALRTPCGLDGGVLAVDGVDVLGVVAAGDVGDPGVRDVRAGDGALPTVFFS